MGIAFARVALDMAHQRDDTPARRFARFTRFAHFARADKYSRIERAVGFHRAPFRHSPSTCGQRRSFPVAKPLRARAVNQARW
ncbi:hypothetical protein BRPE64_DCDS02480 (plasmid) [Caballeronia insecticola]|uniref:Uncharacterized protein n=1 Tax=Caballeronia insecticola TaxID=758793 RepID=R4WRI4_9BURK|nr:hypothetical protein BRPE64_DCDS02480 [Caballeronia insecticola]